MKKPKMSDNCLLLFKNVHDVIRSEKLIKSKEFDYQIIPVPSNISSECGMCIKIDEISSIEIINILKINNINCNIYSK